MTRSPEDELLRLLLHFYRRGHIGQFKAISPAVCPCPLQPPHDHAATASGNLPAPRFIAILLHLSQRPVLATPVLW